MSNLKDTDIDDLFRRASERFPLRTDSSDWDRMAAALEKDPPPPDDGTDPTDRRKKRRFFWLFFLLPLGAGVAYYSWHSGAGSKPGTTGAHATVATNTPATVNTSETASATPATNIPVTGAPAATGTPAPTTTVPATTDGAVNTSPVTASPDATRATAAHPTTSINGSKRQNNGHLGNTGHQANTNEAFAHANTTLSARGTAASHDGTAASHDGTAASHDGTAATNNSNTSGNNTTNSYLTSLTPYHQDRLFYDLQRAPFDHNYQLNVNVTAPAAKRDATPTKQKTSPKPKTSYLYAGLLVAPDISTVKMQAVKGVGNTFGALVGFAFNSHWAIETGAYVERKKYYTQGEYFNTKEVNLQPYTTLSDVNGTCYMWEIPLNVRYTFNPEGKTRWFATAGFSTYLMTRENYTYGYEWSRGGSSWPGDSSWNIKKPSQYPFSIVNLSAGFEQRLGKVGNLRIEPYLRIPLTGMGTGKLPIMSTGINIGITRQLWKK